MGSDTLIDGWTVFDEAPVALALADRHLRIVRVNRACAELIGHPAERLLGRDLVGLMRHDDRAAGTARLATLLAGGPSYAVDACFTHADGRDVWLRAQVGVVRGADGEPLVMGEIEDTTEHRRAAARLRRLAERDHLTGLLNRRRVEEELEHILAGVRRHARTASLVLIDLDHFKAVNDRDGHEAGDRVLSFVAAMLLSRVRDDDVVGRLGGDEFAVLLRDVGAEGAEQVATELVELVGEAGFTLERGVTFSAGVAELHPGVRTAQEALHAADLAMYAAKAAGRNRVAVYDAADPGAAVVSPFALGHEDDAGTPELGSGALLDELGAVAGAPRIERALRAVRELLEMDISYVTRHTDDEQIIVALGGDGASFGIAPGTRLELEETYCRQILGGRLPAAMPDLRSVPRAAAMAVTLAADVGAFVSVPIALSDGAPFGTLCAADHRPSARLGERDVQFLRVLARLVAAELERDAAAETELRLRVQTASVEALLAAVETRDRVTGVHSRKVVELAEAVAAQLALSETERREVAQVALLHDIGKLRVPDTILLKPGPLTAAETSVMQRHPVEGGQIVAAIPELAHLAAAVRAEHERWDGDGYPDGLMGRGIPLASRIVFACDAWDAMTSDRPYRSRLAHADALGQLVEGDGSQFCPDAVQALLTVLATS